jgi:hypothetical protein
VLYRLPRLDADIAAEIDASELCDEKRVKLPDGEVHGVFPPASQIYSRPAQSAIKFNRSPRRKRRPSKGIPAVAETGYCRIERVCVLRGLLRDATDAFLAVLDDYTLADLIKPNKALSALLLPNREPSIHAV